MSLPPIRTHPDEMKYSCGWIKRPIQVISAVVLTSSLTVLKRGDDSLLAIQYNRIEIDIATKNQRIFELQMEMCSSRDITSILQLQYKWRKLKMILLCRFCSCCNASAVELSNIFSGCATCCGARCPTFRSTRWQLLQELDAVPVQHAVNNPQNGEGHKICISIYITSFTTRRDLYSCLGLSHGLRGGCGGGGRDVSRHTA